MKKYSWCRLISFILLLILLSGNLWAQNIVSDNSNHIDTFKLSPKREKTVSLNMTSLLSMVLPFNKTNPFLVGPYNVAFKSYRNNRGWRFGIGANLNGLDDDLRNSNLNLRIGYEWRKPIYKRWYYTKGIDLNLFAGSLNIPNTPTNAMGMGISSVWGIEYYIQDRVSISTETALLIATLSDIDTGIGALNIMIIPPIGLFLNVKFDKKRR
jgi:hypothetical protein